MKQHNRIKHLALWAGLALSMCSYGASYAIDNPQETPVNSDQVDGRVGQAKGKVKEVTGKILDDKGMEIKGNVQKNVGKAQAGYGDLKQEIKEDLKK